MAAAPMAHCHWLPWTVILNRDKLSNLAATAVIFCPDGSGARAVRSELLTKPLRFTGRRLELNVDPGGQVGGAFGCRRFRNAATEYDIKSGIKCLSCAAK